MVATGPAERPGEAKTSTRMPLAALARTRSPARFGTSRSTITSSPPIASYRPSPSTSASMVTNGPFWLYETVVRPARSASRIARTERSAAKTQVVGLPGALSGRSSLKWLSLAPTAPNRNPRFHRFSA
jgi:hypothetical protein